MRTFLRFPSLLAVFCEQSGSRPQGCLADNHTAPAKVKENSQHKLFHKLHKGHMGDGVA